MWKKIRNILLFILILAAAGAAYVFIFRRGETEEPGLSTASGSPASGVAVNQISQPPAAIGQEFISMLLSVQAINLDSSIFTSTAFQSLKDFTVNLVQDVPAGRPNPFAPVGAEDAASN